MRMPLALMKAASGTGTGSTSTTSIRVARAGATVTAQAGTYVTVAHPPRRRLHTSKPENDPPSLSRAESAEHWQFTSST